MTNDTDARPGDDRRIASRGTVLGVLATERTDAADDRAGRAERPTAASTGRWGQ